MQAFFSIFLKKVENLLLQFTLLLLTLKLSIIETVQKATNLATLKKIL